MGEEKVWNDEKREELRELLRSKILGELRMAKNDSEIVLCSCREVYIDDDCPEEEREYFVQFASEELERVATKLAREKTAWPDETDCDRLDRVEAALRERGIVLWQCSPCCDSCTLGELSDRIDVIDGRHPGFRDRMRGYAFFIDQNLPESLAKDTHVSVYLAYGWASPDGSEVAQDVYAKNALAIAHDVCNCLRGEGFEIDWNGDLGRKIGVSLNWQRRTILE